MEGKVAVLGSADFVMPFSTMGLDTYPVGDEREEIIAGANEIIEGRYALVVVSEQEAEMVEEIFSAYQNLPIPSIVVVPFTTESTGFATRALGKVLKMAMGVDILQSN
jgi:V/A-type H+-transporting ATPase subunit F